MNTDGTSQRTVGRMMGSAYPTADTMTVRALLIDDDTRIAELLANYLAQNGVQLSHAPDGTRGLAMLESGAFDLVLLDLMMPGMDGLEVCKRIRAKNPVPIVMLTARGDETDRVVGLEMGADDYLAKPFSPRELLARMRAVLRRAMPDPERERVVAGDIVIDVPSREVKVGGRTIELTGIEFDLLVALARRAGRVVPRDAILSLAGRDDVVVGERTVDVHISHLRAKLGDDPKNPRRIKTVRGVGYMLTREGAA
jgi:DNA-binding response OmpR family regulator